MCPLWPLHWVLAYLFVLVPLWVVTCQAVKAAAEWNVGFSPAEVAALQEAETRLITFNTTDLTSNDIASGRVDVVFKDPNIASAPKKHEFILKSEPIRDFSWSSSFNVTGNFLGYTSMKLRLSHDLGSNADSPVKESKPIKITVVRKPRVIDRIFTISVIVLVSIIFINFGCALDVVMLKRAVIRPVGPLIGLACHFFFLPLLGYGLGLLLFPDIPALRLGLFFTAVSPAGGASNIWTVTLGGNLNLSVTMTAVSTLASFVFIPLWVLTLGRVIFADAEMAIPYRQIITSAVGLFVPLIIGYLVQVYWKNAARLMVRILKPFSACLIIFIVVFAIVSNLYLFQLFTWKIVVGGLGVPLVGYLVGWVLASLLKQPGEDVLAIAIETGVQNTGIAIFLLRFCLGQPEADLTTVIPVSVAIMTPIPVLILYLVRRCRGDLKQPTKVLMDETESCVSPVSTINTVNA